mmetsp:Transcript_84582/g.168899  ORF Transcript_84582/g.168899 Transcript_84582/m.168899 type:complete len:85 (+) Transcript_84582:153-407(+)
MGGHSTLAFTIRAFIIHHAPPSPPAPLLSLTITITLPRVLTTLTTTTTTTIHPTHHHHHATLIAAVRTLADNTLTAPAVRNLYF